MAIEIRMPEVAADMVEADLVTWLVKPGDRVSEGELIAEIETDKSTVEFESPAAGVLAEIRIPAGTSGVRVGEVLAILSEGDEPRPRPGTPPQTQAREESPGNDAQPAKAASPPPAAVQPAPPAEPESPASRSPAVPAEPKTRAQDRKAVVAEADPRARDREAIPAEPQAKAKDGAAVRAEAEPKARKPEGVPATALARRLASQGGLDLATVEGTGAGGRVVKADVEARLAGAAEADRPPAPAEAEPRARDHEALPAEPQARARDRVAVPGDDAFREIPHTRMRKTIARRLSDAKRTIPHFYLRSECRLDDLLELRAELNEGAEREDKLSVNDFIVRASALALQEVPEANASWGEDALILYERSDIAVAVATGGGLVTPVVRSADRKGLATLSREIRDLAARARTGKLLPSEYQGGTFSVSNLGMYGVDGVYAIVNPPQSCILGVGAGEQRPAVVDGELGVATLMTCTLSADHRVVDGAVAARLLSGIKRRIENPLGMAL